MEKWLRVERARHPPMLGIHGLELFRNAFMSASVVRQASSALVFLSSALNRTASSMNPPLPALPCAASVN